MHATTWRERLITDLQAHRLGLVRLLKRCAVEDRQGVLAEIDCIDERIDKLRGVDVVGSYFSGSEHQQYYYY